MTKIREKTKAETTQWIKMLWKEYKVSRPLRQAYLLDRIDALLEQAGYQNIRVMRMINR